MASGPKHWAAYHRLSAALVGNAARVTTTASRPAAAAEADDRNIVDVLADRTFGTFLAANALSNVGNWFQNVAAGIVVFELTRSNTAVGAVSMVQFAAMILLAPWMGAVTDRVDRRRMLMVGQGVAFAGAAALAVTVIVRGIDGLGGPWPIYLATALIGLGAAISLPALQAIVPALVRPGDLDRAIALNSMTFNVARSVGPISAGAVVGAFGAVWAFGVNVLTFVPLLAALALITPRGEVRPADDGSGSVGGGVRWILDRPDVVAVLAATLIVGWTSDPFSTLMPALADELGGGELTVGLLVGCFGLGAAFTAPASDAIRRAVGRPNMIPLGLGAVALGLTGMAASPALPLTLVAAAVAGGGFLLGVTSTNTELQSALPEGLRGRVMAWWSVAFLGCRPFAALVDGVVADAANVRVALMLAAAIAITAAGIVRARGGLTLRDG